METIRFVANITNNEDSNIFLRAVWAAFRAHFGKCAWLFAPLNFKESKITILGDMDIGESNKGAITVTVIYKTKGTVHTIEFSKVEPKVVSNINKILSNTLANYKTTKTEFSVKFNIRTMYPISRYEAPNISIIPQEDKTSIVLIKVNSYDEKDAQFVFKKKYNLISYFLYTQFWTPITLEDINSSKELEISKNIFLEHLTLNPNDEYSVHNGYYHLNSKALDFLNYITSTEKYSKHVERYLSAARHFKIAVDFERKSYNALIEDIDYPEVIITSYMSALEVLSINDNVPREQCSECHQIKYSISQRVKTLVTQALNRPDIIQTINTYYQSRSKFLHEGIFLSHMSYTAGNIPQVSRNDDGVEHQHYMPAALKFYVGDIFDWVLKNNIYFE